MDKVVLTFILILSIGAVLCDKPDHKDDIIDTPIFNVTNSEAKKPNPVSEDKHQTQPTKKTLPEYYNPPFDPENPSEPLFTKSGARLITINELAAHGSVNGTLRPIWLAIMGRVYDVEKGYDSHYGPKGGYNFFTGRDGSKAFVTGKFDDEGLTDDVSELTPLQLKDIEDWIHFYDKDYTYVGKLIGRYYDKTGNPTKELYKYQRNLAKAEEIKAEQQAQEKQFPPCNSRYTPAEGGLVYCSTNRYILY